MIDIRIIKLYNKDLQRYNLPSVDDYPEHYLKVKDEIYFVHSKIEKSRMKLNRINFNIDNIELLDKEYSNVLKKIYNLEEELDYIIEDYLFLNYITGIKEIE